MDALSVFTLVLLILAVLLLVAVVILLFRRQGDRDVNLTGAVELLKAELLSRQSESLHTLRDSIDAANRMVNDRLAEGTSSLDRRMAVLSQIDNRLGELTTQTSNIEQIGRNIQSLSELLRPPKLRGQLGELLLENLLAQILPRAMFSLQHRFQSGGRVDAVIHVADRLLPVDAKFPIEAYERLTERPDDPGARKDFSRTLKKHIDAIADKYIRPAEQTTEFAVMYIPAEAVYYQLVTFPEQEILDYALSRRVIPSSPGHLYAFMASVAATYSQVVLARDGLADEARWLSTGLSALQESSTRLAGFHERMEGSLRALSTAFERARTELGEIRLQVDKLRDPFAEKNKAGENPDA
ncbi:MAG: DNA recombination protein RmuC [candidate division Zixibacteria bacterium]|nr:DNA recombination protein RmuC [candidate division Zixibacteria bacterium]